MILNAPLFLLGLLAAGIPVIIHLLQLRRYQKVYFSNVEALQEIQTESRKRNQLREWLILATRVLAVVFLVLAFCQPMIPNRKSQVQAGGTAVSVYVDNSFSMENGGMEGSLLEEARKKAREIVASYKPDDKFQLLTNEVDGAQFRWLSREDFLEELDKVEISPLATSLESISARQSEFMHTAPATNRHAYWISDFQLSTASLDGITPDTNVLTTFVPIAGSEVDNIYIDTLIFDCPAYYRGNTVRVVAKVTNGGKRGVEKLPLRLFIGEKQRALASVDLAAGETSDVPLNFVIEEDGLLFGRVELTDYPITFDDPMYFVLATTQRIPVLTIQGGNENSYLTRLLSDDTLIGYRTCGEQAVDFVGLEKSQMIVLDELRAIPSGLAQALQGFVEQGGTLLVIPSAKIDKESYNRFLASLHAPLLGDWRNSELKGGEINTEHELYRGVFVSKSDEMELPAMHGGYAFLPSPATVMEPILTLVDGSNYLVSTQAEQGRLYLFATPLQEAYTDFMKQALFVPTVYNMALYSSPMQHPYHLLTSSEPIALRQQLDEGMAHLRSLDSLVDIIPDLRRQGARQYLIPHAQLTRAGGYLFDQGEEGLAFNYSREESRLEFYSREEISKAISDKGWTSCTVVNNSQKSMSDYIRQRNQGRPLWRWCLMLCLLMLGIETLLIRLMKK